jgi:NAD(P)-dependent dehydrogenase (short-subunit alcohol dehydrogenase family)
MPTLSDKSVFITGSDRGIGKAIALAFANAGSRVAVHGLATPDEAEAAFPPTLITRGDCASGMLALRARGTQHHRHRDSDRRRMDGPVAPLPWQLGPLSALTVDAPYRYSVLAPI